MGMMFWQEKETHTSSVESGSLLPLMILIFLISLFAYTIGVDIYAAKVTKFKLESWSEDLVASLFSEVSPERYFFDHYSNTDQRNRNFVPVDCDLLRQNLESASRSFPHDISIENVECHQGQLKLVLTEQLTFPFFAKSLVGIAPKVVVHVSGGLQRVRTSW